jgi:hypothetical protein
MADSNTFTGTFWVNCSGSACRQIIGQSKKMDGLVFAFRVDKKSQGDPDVVVNVSGSMNQIQRIEQGIKKINGVSSVNREIGNSLLY